MFPVIDSRGKLVNVVCQWVDITERKQAEKSLAESENKFRSIAEHAVDCIFIKDIDRRYVFVNQAIQDLFGLPEEEILGRTPQDIFGHESGLVVAELDDRTFSGETVNETRSLEVGDKEMFFHTIQTPLTSEKDAITSIMGIVRDVTETKHAEEELRRSKRTAESYLNIAAEIIVSLNAQGNITMMNESGHAILGYDKGDLIGKDWFDTCLPERLRKDVRMVFKQLMQGDVENVRTFENPIVTKDGIEKIVLWHNSILRDETGNICGILSSGEDITETKRLQELESRAQRLETAGTIAGQVAHDFNNLLAPLMAYPDLIREDLALNHPALAYLDDIEDSAKKIADINQQLLTLGRRGHYNQVALNLNAIIHQAVKELAPLADDVTCTTDLAPDLMNILGGASQLHRVTTNILSNAVDALQNVGHIHVKTESYYADDVSGAYGRVPKGEYVKLTISDTGCGMSDDIAQKIFDPFFTTKSTDMKRGSGLGLSVVDAVVKDHGGYLDIETIVGKGTSFYVYFPITREALNDDRSGETCGGSESILIVDDEGIQREVSTQLLEKLGYDVNSVDSGEKALKCLRENPYDLVVLDMVMPCGIDGAETYRQILEINPAQKAIIMSGFSETDRVQVAMKLGAGAFVKKPVTRQTIAVAVRTELDRQANILI
jgi:PAS domain S-box-containing protein